MIGNELLSIKEFSKLTGIKQTTLRHYDDIGIFEPARRGGNSYRYYSPQQLTTINSIKLLQNLDMPMKRIVETVKFRSPESMHKALHEKEKELIAEIERLTSSYNVIQTQRKLIEEGLGANENEISVVSLKETRMTLGSRNVFGHSDYFYDTFLKFCAEANEKEIDLRFSVGGMFEDFDTFLSEPSQPTYFFSVDPNGKEERPSGKYVMGYARGYYGEVGDLPERMSQYIKENGLKPKGPLNVVYLLDEICVKDHNQYLFQATVRI
jgi:DNA-binding transcriptional MerR regulator